jgi:hypothetical protein
VESSLAAIEKQILMDGEHDHAGYVWKQAVSGKQSWKRRWAVLDGCSITYYESDCHTDGIPKVATMGGKKTRHPSAPVLLTTPYSHPHPAHCALLPGPRVRVRRDGGGGDGG